MDNGFFLDVGQKALRNPDNTQALSKRSFVTMCPSAPLTPVPVIFEMGDIQTLAAIGNEIRLLFDLLTGSHLEGGLENYSEAAWEYEFERFGLWANNLGLHHRGHSSLDYRTREADALKKLISSLLNDLKTTLNERELFIYSFLITWDSFTSIINQHYCRKTVLSFS